VSNINSGIEVDLRAANGQTVRALLLVDHIVGVREVKAPVRSLEQRMAGESTDRADIMTDNGGRWDVAQTYDEVVKLLKEAWKA
jgi:hypothetical protein